MPEIVTPQMIRKQIRDYESVYNGEIVPDGVKGALRGALGAIPDNERKLALSYLFKEPESALDIKSSKTLTESQWYALKLWANIRESFGYWSFREGWDREYRMVGRLALAEYQSQNGVEQPPLF